MELIRGGTVIFLHLPKTGGTTLTRVIREHYGRRAYRIGDNRRDPRPLAEFRGMSDRRKAHFDLVAGHVPYGIHEDIPGDCTYFTLLREPVDRLVSLHHYVTHRSPVGYRDILAGERPSLASFVRSRVTAALDNGQTRFIAGRDEVGTMEPGRPVDEHDFERAKTNLEAHFAFAGILEKFDASLAILAHLFGWRIHGHEPANVSRNRLSLTDLDAETREVLVETNRYDLALYDHVRTNLDALLARPETMQIVETADFSARPPLRVALRRWIRRLRGKG
jgi:hypothetical protein